jgi:hypothetical protein
MNQALYAHMNNKRKMKKKKDSLSYVQPHLLAFCSWFVLPLELVLYWKLLQFLMNTVLEGLPHQILTRYVHIRVKSWGG